MGNVRTLAVLHEIRDELGEQRQLIEALMKAQGIESPTFRPAPFLGGNPPTEQTNLKESDNGTTR